MAHTIRRNAPPWIDWRDLEQEALLYLLQGRKSYSGPMLDYLRREQRANPSNPHPASRPSLDFFAPIDRNLDARALLGSLSNREIELLRLVYAEELSNRAIGRILRRDASRVSQLHARAINNLRRIARVPLATMRPARRAAEYEPASRPA